MVYKMILAVSVVEMMAQRAEHKVWFRPLKASANMVPWVNIAPSAHLGEAEVLSQLGLSV